jgi:hypothetical protein
MNINLAFVYSDTKRRPTIIFHLTWESGLALF